MLVFTAAFVLMTSLYYGGSIPIMTRGEVYYSGDRSGNKISLMFNVYENTECVNGIMDILAEYGVKATFFVGGCWADDNEATLKRMCLEGHEIANHGYFHLAHDKISLDRNIEEIFACERVVDALSGAKTTLFAPPSGAYGDDTLAAADSLGYKVVMWTRDTIDWRDHDVSLIYKRATKNAKGGDFILMHPTACTKNALCDILDEYIKRGLTQTTVSDNIGE